jgi:hypothetical protein
MASVSSHDMTRQSDTQRANKLNGCDNRNYKMQRTLLWLMCVFMLHITDEIGVGQNVETTTRKEPRNPQIYTNRKFRENGKS